MKNKPNIDILLATYNGEKYLAQQLDSLLNQTYPNTSIFIRDDKSKDSTVSIINNYKEIYPNKITFIEGIENDNKSIGNFSILMNYAKSDYILFSDQDDIWEKDKVEKLFNKIRSIEIANPNIPIYVFSDLSMIDEHGNQIAPSLWEKEGISPTKIKMGNLLTQNVANGCASIFNRHLLEIGKNIPKGVLMHDHWLIIIASAVGVVDFILDKTIKHRIHQSNSSRAESDLKKERNTSWKSIVKGENLKSYHHKLQNQAVLIKERLEGNHILPKSKKEVLDEFINLNEFSFFKKKYLILKNGFLKNKPTASINWWLRV